MGGKVEKSKISNTEWGLVIGALFVVDVIQFLLDVFFEVGVLINRFIDIVVGMALGFYLWVRGELGTDPDNLTKKALGLLATFVGEEIPDVDALPLWTADGVYNWLLAKERNHRYEKENKPKVEANKIQQQQQRMQQLQAIRERQQAEQQEIVDNELYEEAA